MRLHGCKSLISVQLPDNITKIGKYAFSGCSKMTEFVIPATVTELGENAWPSSAKIYVQADSEGHRVLEESKKIYFLNGEAKNVTTNYAIKNEELWDISAKKDGSATAIWNLENKSLTISGKGKIGALGYEDNEGKWIEHKYCAYVESVNIENGITEIGYRAFYDCTALNTVSIPDSVTNIENEAFSSCIKLGNINLPEHLVSIGDKAFLLCTNFTNVNIPISVTSIGKMAFGFCSDLESINVNDKNSKYASKDGVLFTKGMSELITYPINNAREQYIIPYGVNQIDAISFWGCVNLKSVNIPDTVTNIDEFAFYVCMNLNNIKIPDSVISFGDSCFYKKTVIYAKSNSKAIDYAKQNQNEYIIDDDAPVANVSIIESSNKSAIVKINSNEELQQVNGWALSSDQLTLAKTYTENITENIIVKDLVGNTTNVKVQITNIDTTAPIAQVSYSTTELTSQDVVVTIKVNEKIQEVDGWILSADNLILTKTYTANTTETVTIKDLAGNTITVTIRVNNIDKTDPDPTPTFELKQYQIKDNYIVKIKPKTKYRDFIKVIETNLKYTIKEKDKEISGEDLIKTGQTLTTEDGHTYTLVVIGDLSGDGKIGIVELARISKIGSGRITDIKEIEKMAIDVNADGKINIIDLAAISKYAAE